MKGDLNAYLIILIACLIPSILSFEYLSWWLPILGIFPAFTGLRISNAKLVNFGLVWGGTSYLFLNRHLTFGPSQLVSVLIVLLLFFIAWRILEMLNLSSKMLKDDGTSPHEFHIRYLKHLSSTILIAFVLTIIALFTAIYGITTIPYGSTTYTIFYILLTIVFLSLLRLLVHMHQSKSKKRL